MVDWVLEYARTKCEPSMIVPPEVDLRPRRHPAQLASDVMSITSTMPCHLYLQMSLGLPFKYLPMRLSISHPLAVGRDISRHISFTAYCMSGRSGCW